MYMDVYVLTIQLTGDKIQDIASGARKPVLIERLTQLLPRNVEVSREGTSSEYLMFLDFHRIASLYTGHKYTTL